MSNDEKLPPSPISQIEHAPNYQELYCNHLRLAMTPYDLVMTVGHIADKSPNNPVLLEDASIRFSPQQFKVLAMNAMAAISAWEAQFGAIPIKQRTPEEIMSAITEASDRLKKTL
jgi:hypothetical protein